MGDDSFYTDAQRVLQDRFDSRRLADRLLDVTVSETFSVPYQKMIGRAPFFWLATADADGWPDVSYKGGRPGFVRVLDDERTVGFPSYDGNGMYLSMGNIAANPRVGLLFVDFERPKRLRVKGRAVLREDRDLLARWPGAELVVTVEADKIFFNCPRYIHRMAITELSMFAPADDHEPPEPEWKESPDFKPYLPGAAPTTG
jgi:predicted pyridoxine 5'-phosphate oxidase superfamily flavin-nucleotide-binding protein